MVNTELIFELVGDVGQEAIAPIATSTLVPFSNAAKIDDRRKP